MSGFIFSSPKAVRAAKFRANKQQEFAIELYLLHGNIPTFNKEPEWTAKDQKIWAQWPNAPHRITIFNATLPCSLAERDEFIRSACYYLGEQMIERNKKTIKQIARVETPEQWTLWIETD